MHVERNTHCHFDLEIMFVLHSIALDLDTVHDTAVPT